MNSSLKDAFNFEHISEADKKIWVLMRLDDNGNEFEMATFNHLEAAEVARKTYADKGHKQLYFLRKK